MVDEQTTRECPGCQRLGRENAHLKVRLAEVERQLADMQRRLEEQQRTERRQAVPFGRRHHKAKPKRPGHQGRERGGAAGSRHRRAVPD